MAPMLERLTLHVDSVEVSHTLDPDRPPAVLLTMPLATDFQLVVRARQRRDVDRLIGSLLAAANIAFTTADVSSVSG